MRNKIRRVSWYYAYHPIYNTVCAFCAHALNAPDSCFVTTTSRIDCGVCGRECSCDFFGSPGAESALLCPTCPPGVGRVLKGPVMSSRHVGLQYADCPKCRSTFLAWCPDGGPNRVGAVLRRQVRDTLDELDTLLA